MKISMIGSGMFGFPIANFLAKNNDVCIFDNNRKLIDYMITNKHHKFHFKKITLENNLKPTHDLNEALKDTELIILAVPSSKIKEIIKKIKQFTKNPNILNLSKGLGEDGNLISQIIQTEMKCQYAVISGGMIAKEFVENKPLFATLASKEKKLNKQIQKLFADSHLCLLTTNKVKETEICGPLKNIMATLAGLLEEEGFHASTIGGLICVFNKEIEQIFEKLNYDKSILTSPAWTGDLIATCFGNSRNKEFGKLLVHHPVEEAIKIMKKENKLIEGHRAIKTIYLLMKDLNLKLNIISIIYKILFEHADLKILTDKKVFCNKLCRP